jgi:two-component system cell cycle sensor histidine kinase/response regulator CckA
MKTTNQEVAPRDVREVAHDLNNLLAAIAGASEAILSRTGLDMETRADIAHIQEGALRGGELARRLHHQGAERPAPVLVNEAIRATYRLIEHRLGSGTTLRLELGEPDGLVCVEPSQLDRALLNLAANARHAMPEGGTVTLRTSRITLSADAEGFPDTIPAGDYMTITVADDGSGIPPENLQCIFDRGFSSRHNAGGSGLGLASTLDTVHAARGYIAVVSRVGCGTRFRIHLPRQVSGTELETPATPNVSGQGRVVLLVDDEPILRKVTERALRRANWTVLPAESGEIAQAILEKKIHLDAMISDVSMPGTDGLALTRLALDGRPDLPVVLTSGHECEGLAEMFGTANVVFLAKPYRFPELFALLARNIPPGKAVTSDGIPCDRPHTPRRSP